MLKLYNISLLSVKQFSKQVECPERPVIDNEPPKEQIKTESVQPAVLTPGTLHVALAIMGFSVLTPLSSNLSSNPSPQF